MSEKEKNSSTSPNLALSDGVPEGLVAIDTVLEITDELTAESGKKVIYMKIYLHLNGLFNIFGVYLNNFVQFSIWMYAY